MHMTKLDIVPYHARSKIYHIDPTKNKSLRSLSHPVTYNREERRKKEEREEHRRKRGYTWLALHTGFNSVTLRRMGLSWAARIRGASFGFLPRKEVIVCQGFKFQAKLNAPTGSNLYAFSPWYREPTSTSIEQCPNSILACCNNHTKAREIKND